MAKVGILGHGVVGSGVAQILLENADVLEARAGEKIELARVCDLREFDVSYKALFTKDAAEVYSDPEIGIVVECMGGKGAAYRFVKAALENGKHVVTSNKELIADCGTELEAIAAEKGVFLRYEASCGGGIPVIKPIREDLGANRLTRVVGILNGTTNYILTRMRQGGVSFAEALSEAQQKGYAEADPSADVLGWDARRKICILAHVAFGTPLDDSSIKTEGIDKLTREDMLYARALGRAVKLLGMAELVDGKGWRASVAPAMVAEAHPLASVSDVFNAVMVHGDRVDDVMFYGRGAGTAPTASAVCGDVLDIVRCPVKRGRVPDGSGLDLLERLKALHKRENVIIISAKDSLEDKVLGLELGADDYLPKPFHLAELNARIKSVIRRNQHDGEIYIRQGNVRIEPDKYRVFVNEQELELNRKEYDILLYFINRPGRLVNKNTLAESVWGDHIDQVDNFDFIYAQIKNLRKKLKDAEANIEIKAVYGFGYKLIVE